MSKIYQSLTELVGNTPLLEIKNIEANGLSHSIQDFVEREVMLHNCYLQFLDNYMQSTVKEFDGSLF